MPRVIAHSAEDRTYLQSAGVLVFLLVALFGKKFELIQDQTWLLGLAMLAGVSVWWGLRFHKTQRQGICIEQSGRRRPRVRITKRLEDLEELAPNELASWVEQNREDLIEESHIHLVAIPPDQVSRIRQTLVPSQ